MLQFLTEFPIRSIENDSLFSVRISLLQCVNMDTRNNEDASLLKLMKGKIALQLPNMFLTNSEINTALVEPSRGKCEIEISKSYTILEEIQTLSPFLQSQIAGWLTNCIFKFVVQPKQIGINNWRVISNPLSSLLNVRQYSFITAILEKIKDFYAVLEVIHFN